MTPRVEMRPKVGFSPTTPQNAAGRMIEPIVWVPSASGQYPAATAAAEPLLDPPGVCWKECGLRVGPGVKYANSVVTVFPSISAPADLSRATLSASEPVNAEAGRRLPAWVGHPST